MGKKAEELIKAIGDRIIEELEGFDEYEIEYDEYGFDNASVRGWCYFEYGNSGCDLEFSAYWTHKSEDTECHLYGCEGIHEKRYKKLECLEKAVNDYVYEHLDTDALLDAIKEKYQSATEDEWESHGFRDAQDYYSWRYG